MYKKNVVLFDLDGTVINSKEGIFNSLYYTFDKLGMIEQDEHKLQQFIGPSIGSSFQNLYQMTNEEAIHAVSIYREYYQSKGIYECEPYEGIEELFLHLKQVNKRIAIATKKPEPFAITVMEHLGLAKYMDAICGSDLNEADNSKAHIIQTAADLLKTNEYNEVVMIGDTKYDVIGAKKVNIDCIGVLYGFGSEQELIKHGAIAIAKDMNELNNILCQ
ncbi:HAD hydrolase-like protein [Paludicola sp. MB14-C6]|uniref:HAD hydrolase-like protein n=1 Tax=Paludihabitans sp. MB14-C6 TaxID=3070656 RepID=UPI0027DCADFE|nr:HAD hydrolase-like protein [Paludicola sp. MB14-C6]WMJ22059.1 HAD hydrolase-like protein [Paludicola sp. MB14-C6]